MLMSWKEDLSVGERFTLCDGTVKAVGFQREALVGSQLGEWW